MRTFLKIEFFDITAFGKAVKLANNFDQTVLWSTRGFYLDPVLVIELNLNESTSLEDMIDHLKLLFSNCEIRVCSFNDRENLCLHGKHFNGERFLNYEEQCQHLGWE